ncbi:2'-5' RNA ligase family protein [Herbiconiux liangxiaofengii]|uniref:2'-5' RNA ligase family protein n=1 Tax=Herbiconiux liangxiaofengii TaxID=3342795 RepID=UPI0035B9AEEA
MGDVVSIELVLDEVAEAQVRAEWVALAEAGLSSLAAHTAPSNAPHLTVAVRETLGGFDLGDEVRAMLPLPVTLGAPMLFGAGERRVLVRSVVVGMPLLRLHAALHERLGPGEDAPFTAQGEWTPHVTLARRLKLGDLPRALPLVGGLLAAQVVGVRRWDAAEKLITLLE